MPRQLVIGNGKFLINLDNHTYMRDLYYPYVGQLNHVGGYQCRVGIWVDGDFAWLSDPEWDFKLSYVEESLITEVTATHPRLGITLLINDGVHQREDIYLKRINIHNNRDTVREVRVFFNQDLVINETEVGDTAAYYPANNTVFHYKKDKYFMFSGTTGPDGIYQYTTGVKRFYNAEGTWRDAEDGHLMGNAIAQGSVDSTISFKLHVPPNSDETMYYWMTAGKNLEEVKKLDGYVKDSHPGKLLDRIKVYWQRWVNKSEQDYGDLPAEVIRMYKHSLLIVRTQTDVNGAIIAANDSDIMHSNRDHYSYMWPRDGALIAYAMSMAGYQGMITPFFHFCANVLSPEGYLHHKYNPDGTVGSSWHPYIHAGNEQLPIQEDETALVLFALWKDFEKHGVLELPQSLYRTLIRRAARFMSSYIDQDLNLPKPSYDLWEERYGIFTFTTSAVYGGLIAAANFCSLFGDEERSSRYRHTAERIKSGIIKHLWDEEEQRFVRGMHQENEQWVKDLTYESSVYGIFEFGVLPADDERVVKTMQANKEKLTIKTDIGGVARYYHDYYFQRSSDIEKVPGNPWIICTLWIAEWEIECAKSLAELEAPRRTLEWVVKHAIESGILPEQLDPFDGGPVSVAPLTWSHATYVLTVVKYREKFKKLSEK
ncbi:MULTISPECIES: glycoside hydrolase family 15 protein [Paenibacillus]|jgi:GH15 family glucan-1,4-alpha-glucosidase|uniref:Glycoside hydrolase family 15 protein n=1 Tax=Paenibacillus baimaensis TaxID=2982185 RepID=A0ABT2U890_9BACL|nr:MULTISPECIES: glycoside hydrolase family 15 protein [unclassified Paenibacillus]MCU6790849.1 glycoside hydrolase family 15 protein [Paenibacillus sp. WQ 127069]OMF18596.1 glycoside hydrolase family 15 [Paenibacillus sp. FSL H7-0331]